MLWFFGREAHGILAPRPGMEPTPPALEGEVLTAGPPGKSPMTFFFFLKSKYWASLVAQWLRIRLPMQGTRVQALVQKDRTCRGAMKPVGHNY